MAGVRSTPSLSGICEYTKRHSWSSAAIGNKDAERSTQNDFRQLTRTYPQSNQRRRRANHLPGIPEVRRAPAAFGTDAGEIHPPQTRLSESPAIGSNNRSVARVGFIAFPPATGG